MAIFATEAQVQNRVPDVVQREQQSSYSSQLSKISRPTTVSHRRNTNNASSTAYPGIYTQHLALHRSLNSKRPIPPPLTPKQWAHTPNPRKNEPNKPSHPRRFPLLLPLRPNPKPLHHNIHLHDPNPMYDVLKLLPLKPNPKRLIQVSQRFPLRP